MAQHFDELPLAEQDRIRSASALLANLAQRYANYLVIGEARASPSWNLASCFAVRLKERPLLVTAAHVYQKYLERRALDDTIFAQAGELDLHLEKRVVLTDDSADIAVFDLSGLELALLGRDVYDCSTLVPPREIVVGDYVQFCGFPAHYRIDVSEREGSLASLAGFVEVVDVQPGRLYCYRDRDYMIEFGPAPMPPPLTVLGGLSGGPVLFRSALHYPIVGVVSEFLPSLDTFKCSIFTQELEEQCLVA